MKRTKLLGKIVSIATACIMAISAATCVNAEKMGTYTVYDDAGNEYVLRQDEVLGILYDKDGNVKEQTILPRYAYVNGSMKTLAVGESFATYQYKINSYFSAGFYYFFKHDTIPSTTADGMLKITIQDSASVGGTRNDIISETCSTTYTGSFNEDSEYGISKTVGSPLKSSSRSYYNARYENVGRRTIDICMLVTAD